MSLFLFVFLSAAFLFVWTFPSFVVNTRNLERVARLLESRGIILEWKRANLTAESRSFLVKWVELDAEGFCVRVRNAGLDSCFESVSLSGAVDIKGWLPRYHVGRVDLKGGELGLRIAPGPKVPKKTSHPSQGFWPALPGFLRDVTFGAVDIELKRARVESADVSVSGKAELHALGSATSSSFVVDADLDLRSGREDYRGRGKVELRSLAGPWFGPYSAFVDLDALLPEGKRARVSLQGHPKGPGALEYTLDATYRDRGATVNAKVIGQGDRTVSTARSPEPR